ncbi:hypothetical protein, partial [Massilia mucilaginosa]|uniref:hypothetical protein n=1 Tax=Massilia mucilaginosa TaxID=2609282 RepID=UPI001CB6CF94
MSAVIAEEKRFQILHRAYPSFPPGAILKILTPAYHLGKTKRGETQLETSGHVAVHTPSGIFGSAGTVRPFLAAAMTLAMKVQEEAERFLHVS